MYQNDVRLILPNSVSFYFRFLFSNVKLHVLLINFIDIEGKKNPLILLNLNCISSLKESLILKKSLPLAQEGQKRSCTSQGHCVENQSHCWRIQTSQVWQLKKTTYSYAIHINTCTSNIMECKS